MKNIKIFFLSTVCFLYSLTIFAQSASMDKTIEKTKIITSFYPMYIMTTNLIKDISEINLINLTKPQTGCLHDYQLTPEDVKTLDTGHIFIVNGANMESFLDKVIKQYSQLKIITASKGLDLIEQKASDNEENHHSHHKNENKSNDHKQEPDLREYNPHVWLSVSLAIKQVQNISNELQLLLPNHKEQISKNTSEYVSKLEQLKTKMHQVADKFAKQKIVTFHEAFPYFAKEFNLTIVDVIEREPGSEPSAKELKDVIEKIKKLKVKALFAEPQYPSKAAQAIANETSSKVYFLDPAVTGPMDKDAYIKIMEKNLSVLEGALK